MRIISLCKTLEKDLFDLYCKTNIRSIENTYLKIAEKNKSNLSNAILSTKIPRDLLDNQDVFETLKLLVTLKSRFGEIDPKTSESLKPEIVKFLISEHLTKIPIVHAFKDLLFNNSLNALLKPYQDIISLISLFLPLSSELQTSDIEKIAKDLVVIQDNLFSEQEKPKTGRQTISKMRRQMYENLLKRFSDEMAQACNSVGFNDLANEFRNGTLAKPIPYGLNKHIEFDKVKKENVQLIHNMVEYVWDNYEQRFENYNHDIVEMTFLNAAKELTDSEVEEFKRKFEEERDPIKTMDEKEEYPSIDTMGKINHDKRLNSDYIFMLANFFFLYQIKAKSFITPYLS